mgnify:CR=1 FL=1
MPDFLCRVCGALIVFVKLEEIGAAGGASHLPYEWSAGYIPLAVFVEVNIIGAAGGASDASTHRLSPYGNWVVYGALAVVAGMEMLAAHLRSGSGSRLTI